MNNLKKIGMYIIIAIGIYFLFVLKNILFGSSFSLIVFIILLIILAVGVFYLFLGLNLSNHKNSSVFYNRIDFKNHPDYEDLDEEEELGELINVFSIEYVNPKKVDISKVILPYNRINIIIEYLTDEPFWYASESTNGYNSEQLNSEIEKVLTLYGNKNNFDPRFYMFSEIDVFKDKNDKINVGINIEET